MLFSLAEAQKKLGEFDFDGWLFTDFQARCPLTRRLLCQQDEPPSTRQLYYFIPRVGEAVKIVSRIEPFLLAHLPGNTLTYLGRKEEGQALSAALGTNRRIACQYSPGASIPLIGTLDAGMAERLRTLGVTVESSKNLLSHFLSSLTEPELQSHIDAGALVHQWMRDAFAFVRAELTAGRPLDEMGLLDFLLRRRDELGLVSDFPPFFGADEHAAEPGYEPTSATAKPIREGTRLLLDLAARLPLGHAVYYDISWNAVVGTAPCPRYEALFDVGRRARDRALDLIQRRLQNGESVAGYEVDDEAFCVLRQSGLASARRHRTGHNIGHFCHGLGTNLDHFETKDDRLLLPGTLFSIEPGIYTEGYGIRSEINVYITPDGRQTKVFGPVQQAIVVV